MPDTAIRTVYDRLITDRNTLAESRGFLPERIGIARRLAALDPADHNHRDAQATLELAWFQEAPLAIQAAIQDQDSAMLALLATILRTPGWIHQPPASVITAVQSAQNKLLSNRFCQEHEPLLQALASAKDNEAQSHAWKQLTAAAKQQRISLDHLVDPRVAKFLQSHAEATLQQKRKFSRVAVISLGVLLLIGLATGGWFWWQARIDADALRELRTIATLLKQGHLDKADAEYARIETENNAALIKRMYERQGDPDAQIPIVYGPDGHAEPTIFAVCSWRAKNSQDYDKFHAVLQQLKSCQDQDLTAAGLDQLDRIPAKATPEERNAAEMLKKHIGTVLEERSKKQQQTDQDFYETTLRDALHVINTTVDTDAVSTAAKIGRERMMAIVNDDRRHQSARTAARTALEQIDTAAGTRSAFLAKNGAIQQDLVLLHSDSISLSEYMAQVEELIRRHPDAMEIEAWRRIRITQTALADVDAWQATCRDQTGASIIPTSVVATTYLHDHPDAPNALAIKAWIAQQTSPAENAARVQALHQYLTGPTWMGWRTMTIGDSQRAVPASWKGSSVVRVGDKQILDIPNLQTRNQLEGRDKIPNEMLRLDQRITIHGPDTPPATEIAQSIDDDLKAGRLSGHPVLAVAARILAKKEDLDPLFTTQAIATCLHQLQANQLAIVPPTVAKWLTTLDGLPQQALWLCPDSTAAQNASDQARAPLVHAPDLNAAGMKLAAYQADLTATVAPWIFAGRVISHTAGNPPIYLRPGIHAGQLWTVVGSPTGFSRWLPLGSIKAGGNTISITVPTEVPIESPVLLSPNGISGAHP